MAKLQRYERNLSQEGISQEAQEKLINSKVLIMGVGALGSSVIMNLAALGVGQIKIVDGEVIEEENFNRQIIHKYKNIGRAKVMSAKDWIQEFNPEIKVEIDKTRINELNYFNVVQGYDIIIDCFDTHQAKYMLNEIALRHKKVLIHGATKGFSGQVTTIIPEKTGCLSCVIAKPKTFKDQTYALLSPIASTIASLQAQEAFKVITGVGEPLLNRLLVFDGTKTQFQTLRYTKNMACESCSTNEFSFG